MNAFKELWADLWPVVPYIGHWVTDFGAALGRVTIRPLLLVLRSDPREPLLVSVKQALLILARYPLQFLLTVASLLLNAIATLINHVFSLADERELNEQERRYLHAVFGDNLDYAAIRIQTGGVKEKLKISPQAVAGDIFLRQVWGVPIVNQDSTLTPAGLQLLGHEACHVWQYEHGGAGYIGDSLITQLFSALGQKIGMRLSDGYDLKLALVGAREFKDYNVEQQAVLAELIGVACSTSSSANLSCEEFNRVSPFNISLVEYELVEQAHRRLINNT